MTDLETTSATDGFDEYGNPTDGSRLTNCCFPHCDCDGARQCMAENGRFLAISSGSKYIELAGDEVDHRL